MATIYTWISEHSKFKNVIDNETSESTQLDLFLNLDDIELIKKALRQLHFWKRQLSTQLNDNTVIFALLGPEGLQRPNVMDICIALDKIVDMSKMEEVFSGANNNFMGIAFTSASEARMVREKFSFYNDCLVCFVNSFSSRAIPFRISWLPPQFNLELIHKLLERYARKHEFKKETRQTGLHRFTTTNSVRGVMELLPGVTIDDVPHLVDLPKPYIGSVLISIVSRPTICLKCKTKGHIRKDCKLMKCLKCFSLHLPLAPCPSKSYASTLVTSDKNVFLHDWTDDVDDAPPVGFGYSNGAMVENKLLGPSNGKLNSLTLGNLHRLTVLNEKPTKGKVVLDFDTENKVEVVQNSVIDGNLDFGVSNFSHDQVTLVDTDILHALVSVNDDQHNLEDLITGESIGSDVINVNGRNIILPPPSSTPLDDDFKVIGGSLSCLPVAVASTEAVILNSVGDEAEILDMNDSCELLSKTASGEGNGPGASSKSTHPILKSLDAKPTKRPISRHSPRTRSKQRDDGYSPPSRNSSSNKKSKSAKSTDGRESDT